MPFLTHWWFTYSLIDIPNSRPCLAIHDAYAAPTHCSIPGLVRPVSLQVHNLTSLDVRSGNAVSHGQQRQVSSSEASRTRLVAVARRLVELGAEVEAKDLEGRTPVHLAAGCGHLSMVLHLVALGADVNAADGVGGAAFSVSGWAIPTSSFAQHAHACQQSHPVSMQRCGVHMGVRQACG